MSQFKFAAFILIFTAIPWTASALDCICTVGNVYLGSSVTSCDSQTRTCSIYDGNCGSSAPQPVCMQADGNRYGNALSEKICSCTAVTKDVCVSQSNDVFVGNICQCFENQCKGGGNANGNGNGVGKLVQNWIGVLAALIGLVAMF